MRISHLTCKKVQPPSHINPLESVLLSTLVLGVSLIPVLTLHHQLWRGAETDHPAQMPCLFRKPIHLITSMSDRELVSNRIGLLGRIRGRSTTAVEQLNSSLVFCSTLQPTLLRISQLTVGFCNRLGYTRPPWVSILNQSIKVVTADNRSLFHFPAFPHPLLFVVISKALARLTSQGFTRFTVCSTRGNGPVSI